MDDVTGGMDVPEVLPDDDLEAARRVVQEATYVRLLLAAAAGQAGGQLAVDFELLGAAAVAGPLQVDRTRTSVVVSCGLVQLGESSGPARRPVMLDEPQARLLADLVAAHADQLDDDARAALVDRLAAPFDPAAV